MHVKDAYSPEQLRFDTLISLLQLITQGAFGLVLDRVRAADKFLLLSKAPKPFSFIKSGDV